MCCTEYALSQKCIAVERFLHSSRNSLSFSFYLRVPLGLYELVRPKENTSFLLHAETVLMPYMHFRRYGILSRSSIYENGSAKMAIQQCHLIWIHKSFISHRHDF